MTAIIVSLLIVAAILLSVLGFRWLQNRDRNREENRLIKLFQKIGEKGGLSFSGQEVLSNKIIGLDGLNRKFVVVEHTGESKIINLNEVERCRVQKRWISNQDPAHTHSRIAYIQLHFDFKDRTYESVIFYDHCIDGCAKQAQLETKANDWKTLLSKLIIERRERA